jgi:hypothetical protein
MRCQNACDRTWKNHMCVLAISDVILSCVKSTRVTCMHAGHSCYTVQQKMVDSNAMAAMVRHQNGVRTSLHARMLSCWF